MPRSTFLEILGSGALSQTWRRYRNSATWISVKSQKRKEPVLTASGYDQDEPGCWKESDERLRYPDVFAKAPKKFGASRTNCCSRIGKKWRAFASTGTTCHGSVNNLCSQPEISMCDSRSFSRDRIIYWLWRRGRCIPTIGLITRSFSLRCHFETRRFTIQREVPQCQNKNFSPESLHFVNSGVEHRIPSERILPRRLT